MNKKYFVIACYAFAAIEFPKQLVKEWHRFLREKDAKGRIYISDDGINVQMSLLEDDFASFEAWIRSDERFKDIDIKIHTDKEHVFPKLTIKYREQLAALDYKIDRSLNGQYLSPQEWKEKIADLGSHRILLDVRNDYEYDVGHFEGAIRPDMKTFREFPAFAEKLKKEYDPKNTEVLMFCTGGIRCELFSPLMREIGFEKVYQLKGGVIKYGLEVGHAHWRGKLFVFDDRLVVPIDESNEEVISHCTHCNVKTDQFYNCANMDCNDLFICCPECAKTLNGCCSSECQEAPRVRPFDANPGRVKPYRKLSAEQKETINAQLSSKAV